MARYKMKEEDLTAVLADLPGWEVKEGKLHKSYKFDSFAAAMGWMVSVAIHADKMDHHPEWSNVYNKVQVDLVTHDMDNAISNLDVDLAKKMEALASS
jgi:4a-hydroxytetrahydrobiopterin dehydratase